MNSENTNGQVSGQLRIGIEPVKDTSHGSKIHIVRSTPRVDPWEFLCCKTCGEVIGLYNKRTGQQVIDGYYCRICATPTGAEPINGEL